jgi:hypothetical protein
MATWSTYDSRVDGLTSPATGRHTWTVTIPIVPRRDPEAWPCQSICTWAPGGYRLRGAEGIDRDVFVCTGCGSEWVDSEAWTPLNADGVVPDGIAAERPRAATSEPGAAAAGSVGS